MIGKAFNNLKNGVSSGAAKVQSQKLYDITQGTTVKTDSLPLAPQSAFRKRPVKLNYDSNEYHMFRLPSEDGFLLGSLDKDELFGKRKGV